MTTVAMTAFTAPSLTLARITLARITLARITLARFTLARVALARITLARVALARLAGAGVAVALLRLVAGASDFVRPLLTAVAVQPGVVVIVAVVAVVAAVVLVAVILRRPVILAASRGIRIGAVAEDAEIVLGMLKVSLGGDTIARRSRIACQAQVLLEDLPGIAADPSVGSVAVEGAGSGLATATAAAPATMLFAVGPATRPTSIVIGTLSHRSLASDMDDLPLAPGKIAPWRFREL